MTDPTMTPERAERIARFAGLGHEEFDAEVRDLARAYIAIAKQLAEAQAAQAAFAERAVGGRFRATVKHAGREVGDLPWLEEFWAVRVDDLRRLAPDTGIKALAELRAERDDAKLLMEMRHREMLAADKLMRKHQRRAEEAEAERDDLRARLAEAEWRVKALTEAVDGAVFAMKAARGVIVSKHEHALLTGALVKCAEAKAGIALDLAALSPAGEAAT